MLLPPSATPVALEIAVLTVSTPPFGSDCLPERLTIAVAVDGLYDTVNPTPVNRTPLLLPALARTFSSW